MGQQRKWSAVGEVRAKGEVLVTHRNLLLSDYDCRVLAADCECSMSSACDSLEGVL